MPASAFSTTRIDLTAISVVDGSLTRSESKRLKNEEQRDETPRMLGGINNGRLDPR